MMRKQSSRLSLAAGKLGVHWGPDVVLVARTTKFMRL